MAHQGRARGYQGRAEGEDQTVDVGYGVAAGCLVNIKYLLVWWIGLPVVCLGVGGYLISLPVVCRPEQM